MIVTEKEAAEKWCPHVRYANAQDTLWSNRGDSNGFNGCIGTRCMAWRRCGFRDANGTVHQHEGSALNASRPGVAAPVGYCGIAGKS